MGFHALWLLWLCAVLGGFIGLESYAHTSGREANPRRQWPDGVRLAPPADKPVLVLLAHPRCSCTRATIHELARLMARCRPGLIADVLFCTPKGTPSGWEKTDLYAEAAAIPGVQVFRDVDGIEARRFKGSTSGQILLYDAHGQLLFSGGITAERGHEGDSIGQSLIVEALTGGLHLTSHAPVFGCSLF